MDILKMYVINENIARLQEFFQQGEDVNVEDSEGVTLMQVAASHGCNTALNFLIGQNGNMDKPNKFGWTPLMHAARNGHTETVKQLVKHGANVHLRNGMGAGLLSLAAASGNFSTVKELLQLLLQEDGDAVNALSIAVLFDHELLVRELLAYYSPDVAHTVTGETSLMIAALKGNTEVIKLLLMLDVDIEARNVLGHTASDIASMKENVAVTQILMNYVENGCHENVTLCRQSTLLPDNATKPNPGISYSSSISNTNELRTSPLDSFNYLPESYLNVSYESSQKGSQRHVNETSQITGSFQNNHRKLLQNNRYAISRSHPYISSERTADCHIPLYQRRKKNRMLLNIPKFCTSDRLQSSVEASLNLIPHDFSAENEISIDGVRLDSKITPTDKISRPTKLNVPDKCYLFLEKENYIPESLPELGSPEKTSCSLFSPRRVYNKENYVHARNIHGKSPQILNGNMKNVHTNTNEYTLPSFQQTSPSANGMSIGKAIEILSSPDAKSNMINSDVIDSTDSKYCHNSHCRNVCNESRQKSMKHFMNSSTCSHRDPNSNSPNTPKTQILNHNERGCTVQTVSKAAGKQSFLEVQDNSSSIIYPYNLNPQLKQMLTNSPARHSVEISDDLIQADNQKSKAFIHTVCDSTNEVTHVPRDFNSAPSSPKPKLCSPSICISFDSNELSIRNINQPSSPTVVISHNIDGQDGVYSNGPCSPKKLLSPSVHISFDTNELSPINNSQLSSPTISVCQNSDSRESPRILISLNSRDLSFPKTKNLCQNNYSEISDNVRRGEKCTQLSPNNYNSQSCEVESLNTDRISGPTQPPSYEKKCNIEARYGYPVTCDCYKNDSNVFTSCNKLSSPKTLRNTTDTTINILNETSENCPSLREQTLDTSVSSAIIMHRDSSVNCVENAIVNNMGDCRMTSPGCGLPVKQGVDSATLLITQMHENSQCSCRLASISAEGKECCCRSYSSQECHIFVEEENDED